MRFLTILKGQFLKSSGLSVRKSLFYVESGHCGSGFIWRESTKSVKMGNLRRYGKAEVAGCIRAARSHFCFKNEVFEVRGQRSEDRSQKIE